MLLDLDFRDLISVPGPEENQAAWPDVHSGKVSLHYSLPAQPLLSLHLNSQPISDDDVREISLCNNF